MSIVNKAFALIVLVSYKALPVRYLLGVRFIKSEAVFSKVYGYDSVDSTNLELARQNDPNHFSAAISLSQTLGQGRLGRSWSSPSGASLALSIFLKPNSLAKPGWASLLAALAVSRALADMGIADAGIKWPNDVLVRGKKVCGILAQLQQDAALIVGIGVNLTTEASDLETATSLEALGVSTDADSLAAAIGTHFQKLIDEFLQNETAMRAEFSRNCITLGKTVRAELPGGSELTGLAREIDTHGQLVILTPEPHRLAAADVWHLRG